MRAILFPIPCGGIRSDPQGIIGLEVWIDKNPDEKRIIGNILQIKQEIAIDKIIAKVRSVSKNDILADPLTKGGGSSKELQKVLRNGVLNVQGGSSVFCSTRINSSSWRELLEAR